jgi:hypothetical protein
MRSTLILIFIGLIVEAEAQKQGIKGQVFWLSGNQMPSPDKQRSPHLGIQREIYIYKPTTLQDVEQQDGFFSEIKTELIAKIVTRDDGRFKVKLPPGEYSVFTKEPKGLFANLYDKNSRINIVEVKPKKYTWMVIAVDYEAAY